MKLYLYLSIFLFLLCGPCFAQHGNTLDTFDFASRARVIFEDDFSHDTIGAFPSKWYSTAMLIDANGKNSSERIEVQQHDEGQALAILSGGMVRIHPRISDTRYLPDSFTLEYDFTFDVPGTTSLGSRIFLELFSYTAGHCSSLNVDDKGTYIYRTRLPEESKHTGNYPGSFDHDAWHHVAIAYNNRGLKVYIDEHRLFSMIDCGFQPEYFQFHCWTPVKFKDVKLATGPKTNTYNSLLWGKTFISHNIHFDVDKSEIKGESNIYLIELARLLHDNPKIKIEISGHTDNDGDASHNLALSLARAREVKKRLVTLGIDAERLMARGFGQMKPLKQNVSASDKATNRRVEFTLMK